jgi:hypothetical protein
MNQFPVMAAAEKPASIQTAEAYFAGKRGRGNRDEALTFLTRSGGEAARAGDEVDGVTGRNQHGDCGDGETCGHGPG